MEEVVNSEGGTGQGQGEGNDKKRHPIGSDLSWTLTLWGKTSWKKMCGTLFLGIFSNNKRGGWWDGGKMVSALAQCSGNTVSSNAFGASGTWGNYQSCLFCPSTQNLMNKSFSMYAKL